MESSIMENRSVTHGEVALAIATMLSMLMPYSLA